MKAKIIKTGEIVDVYHEPQHGQITNIYKESVLVNGRMWTEDELELLSNNDEHWQDVREHAAIAAMQGTITILSGGDIYFFRSIVLDGYKGNKETYPNEIAKFACACADALIEELKKK